MPSWYEKSRLAELVAQSCRVVGKLDMTYAALGHVSYRLDDDTMLIKGKGPDEVALRNTSPKDILEVDFNAEPVVAPDGLRPPSESFIHTAIYQSHPEALSVVHIHTRYPVLMALCNKPLLAFGGVTPGTQLALGGVPVYPRSHLINSRELGEALAKTMGDAQVVVMRGHGISVYGSGVEDMTLRAIALDEIAKFNYDVYALGGADPISEDDIRDMTRVSEGPRTRGSAGGASAMLATWRYYCDLVGEAPL